MHPNLTSQLSWLGHRTTYSKPKVADPKPNRGRVDFSARFVRSYTLLPCSAFLTIVNDGLIENRTTTTAEFSYERTVI